MAQSDLVNINVIINANISDFLTMREFRDLTRQEISDLRTCLDHLIQERFYHLPEEGTEDYEEWQLMLDGMNEATSLSDFFDFLDSHSSVMSYVDSLDIESVLDSDLVERAKRQEESALDEVLDQFENHYGISLF